MKLRVLVVVVLIFTCQAMPGTGADSADDC